MAGTLGTAILGNTLLDVLSTQNCNVATFGNQSSNVMIRIYDSNLPYANKNYTIGLCNIDSTYQHNALYFTANQSNLTRIGIGTAFPASTLEIEGVDAIRVPYGVTSERPTVAKRGQIRYNSELDIFEGYGTGGAWGAIGGGGGGATWAAMTSNVPQFFLSSGSFTLNCNVALKRSGTNDVAVQLYIDGRVVTKPTASEDYKVNMPAPISTTSYLVPFVLGELWLVTSNITSGAIAEYKAIAKSIPGDNTYVTIKYLNGTTETSLGDLNSGQNLTLYGIVSYQSSVVYSPPNYNSNNILVDGAAATWTSSLYPYPYLSPPAGGAMTMVYRQGLYRYFGDDIILNVFLQATLNTQPGDTSLNYTMPLEWPVSLTRYTSNAIIGDMWLKVDSGGSYTSYKAYAQTNSADASSVIVRYINGTFDQSLATISTGVTITLQGTMSYKTTAISSLFIPSQYLPNRLYQDTDGRVALNNNGSVVRARWEVIETSNYPAVLIDQRSGADIAQFRSNANDIKAIINAQGNVGIGTSQAALPITVYGNMMFNGIMYDVYGNPLWIPGSSVNWQSTPSAPVISVPTGGTWVQNNALTSGTWRYIGNEVNYNVAVTGTLTVAPTSTVDNFKLTLPAPLKLSSYPVVPGSAMSNVILGELWANVMYGANSNMFKSYAMVDPTNSNQVSLRLLSGTTDTSFSTMSVPSTLTLRGQINYTTTSNIMSIAVPSTSVPANFKQDQYGRVTLNTTNPARGQLDIVLNSNIPGLVVDQVGTGDIAQFMDVGVVKAVVDGSGNIGIGTTTPKQVLDVIGTSLVSGSIGIGTTTPKQALDIVGVTLVSGNVGIGTTIATAALQVRANTATAGVIVDQVGTGNTIDIRNVGVSKMVMDANGNVGVGTTTPLSTLHVNGYVQSSAFAFHLTPSVSTDYGANNTLITAFNTLTTDVNATALGAISGGVFTCQIKGYYCINVNIYSPGANTSWTVRKNANTTAPTTPNGTELGGGQGNGTMSSVSVIVSLIVGDTIKIYTKTTVSAGIRLTIAGGTWPVSSFSGFLITQAN